MSFCQNCGTRLNGEANCPKCQKGNPAASMKPDAAGAARKKTCDPGLLKGLCTGGAAVAFIAVLVVALVAFWPRRAPMPEAPAASGAAATAPAAPEASMAPDDRLDMSWLFGFSIGDSAEALGLRCLNRNESFKYVYEVQQDIIPGLAKGWSVQVLASPLTKRIYLVMASWSPGKELNLNGLSEEECDTVVTLLRNKYRVSDNKKLASALVDEKYRSLIDAIGKRSGLEPISERLDIVKAFPTSVEGYFPSSEKIFSNDPENMFHDIHLFQNENRLVCICLRREYPDYEVGITISDRKLLSEAIRESQKSPKD